MAGDDPAYRLQSWHFHWKFWSPKECTGGPVHFGWWARCVATPELLACEPGARRVSDQTVEQYQIKKHMGLVIEGE